jgi:hypothetical protein
MNRVSVRSSSIQSVGYDPETRSLEVQFHSGGVYQYSGVPEAAYQTFVQAASTGSYSNEHIKDRFPTQRLG